MQNCDELWEWVETFISKGSNEQAELRAQQFQRLCRELGSPQKQFLSVHVAGSKGKGQTASYIAHGLAASGYRVGLYSSPHIHSYSERIQVLENVQRMQQAHEANWGQDISETLLREGKQLRERLSHLEYSQLNFFAILTLLAYFSFSALECDWVVLETGIGGRLCPTNAVTPELSVLTPIELEHTELLGSSLEQIAREKAGIIKAKRPCISAAQNPKVRSVLQSICKERESDLCFFDEAVKIECGGLPKAQGADSAERLLNAFLAKQEFAFDLGTAKYTLGLSGISSTQQENLGLALLAMHCLGIKANLIEGWARLPGRFMAFWHAKKRCIVLFDGAHTPSSCRRLLSDIRQYNPSGKTCLLFGAVEGKKFDEMAAALMEGSFDEVLLTRAGTFKKNDMLALKRAFQGANLLPTIEDPQQALHFLLGRNADLIVVCGSFYLLGELLPQRV